MSLSLTGIIPPLATPFLGDGALDLAAFEANLEAYAAVDFAGYLVLGSNGEAQSLDEPEKLALVRAARARCPSERRLLVGTGLESTRATIELTRRVAELGADAALVLTPHYYRSQMTLAALQRHFEAVADAAPIPVLLYSVPQYTGLALQVEFIQALQGHPNLVGLKESSGDIALLARLRAATRGDFVLACGSAPVLYPALCVGAQAAVLAIAGVVPEAPVQLQAAFRAGDHERARRLQQALTPLAMAVTSGHGVAGLKAAMDIAGYRGGHVRAPLQPVGESVRASLGVLVADLRAVVAQG